jgi:hypothetical protein
MLTKKAYTNNWKEDTEKSFSLTETLKGFFFKWGQKFYLNLSFYMIEHAENTENKDTRDYSPGISSPIRLAPASTQSLASFLILSKTMFTVALLLRKTIVSFIPHLPRDKDGDRSHCLAVLSGSTRHDLPPFLDGAPNHS